MNIRIPDQGPFDIIGDVHGCYDELAELLQRLGYTLRGAGGKATLAHPDGRRAIFVGDLVDRGPNSPAVLTLAMNSVAAGTAYCVLGNHDAKLARKLRGRNVQIAHGLAETLAQIDPLPEDYKASVASFLEGRAPHHVLDAGRLVVAHAGLREDLHGRSSGAARAFAMFGETTGETDEHGLPVRYNWARDYHGKAVVVYGHTAVEEAEWINNTICIDTGCVYGGRLTALRYPERELVSVPAAKVYYPSSKPLRRL